MLALLVQTLSRPQVGRRGSNKVSVCDMGRRYGDEGLTRRWRVECQNYPQNFVRKPQKYPPLTLSDCATLFLMKQGQTRFSQSARAISKPRDFTRPFLVSFSQRLPALGTLKYLNSCEKAPTISFSSLSLHSFTLS